MIYNFSHFCTASGRRVQFTALATDIERAAERLGTSWYERNVRAVAQMSEAEVIVTATPAVARLLVDVLNALGGDAVVAGRMLSEAIDGMVEEIRAARFGPRVTSPPVDPVAFSRRLRATA